MIALIFITAIGALIEYFFTSERVTEEGLEASDALMRNLFANGIG